jgi:hypothetical protein
MIATSATLRRQVLNSATVTETRNSELAGTPDPTKPGPGFVGYDGEDRVVHYCACCEWGSFGTTSASSYDTWYCREHRPQEYQP